MLIILLLVLILHLQIPPTEPKRGYKGQNPSTTTPLPTRPRTFKPHQIKPCISFKKTPCNRAFTLGTSDFVELAQKNEILFDNSQFIKSILDTSNSNPTMLILAPAKWGKTTNLKMLKSFLQIRVSNTGRRIHQVENSTLYNLFRYGEIRREDDSIETLRVPLQISKFEYLFPMFFGKYPVIYISFKDVSGTTYSQIKDKMQKAISNAFREHSYMLNVLEADLRRNKTAPNLARKISSFKDNLYSNSPSEENISSSLLFLCRILNNHFRKKVFVLIDDYDAPLYSALQTPELSEEDIGNVLQLYANLLGRTFSGNPFLKRGIVVGNSEVGEHRTSTWKGHDLHSIVQNPYPMMQYFGLTGDNLRLILDFYNVTAELTRQVFQWYCGYTSSVVGQTFCNPASIIRFLDSKQIQSHFHESCNLEVVNKLLRVSRLYRDDVFALLSEKNVQTGERLILTQRTLSGLQDIFTKTNCTSSESNEITMLFHAHLMNQGVLTVVKSSGSANLAKIPNKEIAFEFSKRIIQYIREQYHIKQEPLKKAATELLDFIRDFHRTDSPNFEHSLRLIYTTSSESINFVKDINDQTHTEEFEPPEYLIFTGVVLEMQCLSKLHYKVYYNSHLSGDIILQDIETKFAIVIQIKDNDTVENALKLAQSYEHALNNTDTSTIKYIGVNVLPSGEVQVLAKIRQVGFTYVEPSTTASLTYPVFWITTKMRKSRQRLPQNKAGHGLVIEYPNGSRLVTTENPFYN